jgi:hypothetical protein
VSSLFDEDVTFERLDASESDEASSFSSSISESGIFKFARLEAEVARC